MYRRSTSKKRAAEAEREARLEEKEATSAEGVEEILLEIEDRQPEPAEEVQQPEDEPEVIPQEIQPEISQPEKPISTADINMLEMIRAIMEETMNKNLESLKEDLNSKIDENSLSTNQNIELLKEENRSTKEELSKKIEDSQRRMEDGQKNMEELLEKNIEIMKENLSAKGKLKVGPKFILPPCKERWVTTAVLVDGMLLCGDRDGSIYLYNLNGNCISSLKYIHGRNGVTCLRYLNNRIWSTGRDGTLRQYALCNNNDDTRNTELCELVADKLAMHWVANIVSSSDDILVVGFHDKSCVVWSAKERNIMVSLPCGGGHRSWDVVLDSEFLHFAFLKNKLANVFSCPVQRICSASLLEGFHPDEINCMKKLSLQDGMWIVSGGEDNTVRISQYKCNKWKTKSVVRSHLSSVRAIATVSLPCGSYVFTAGGRAQIKVWKVVQHFEEDALLIEVASHMLKEEKRTGPWRHVVPINDPEPRYMDIIVSVESEDNIQVLAVAADSRLRLFKFDASQNRIQLCKESLYSNRCLLKVFTVKCSDNCKIVCTVATDGKVAWWDIDKVEENYKPFSVLSLHQSGINSCDWVALSSNKFLLVTGGDDSSLACTVLNFATGPKLNVMKETEQIFRSEHTSNISGIKIWKDLIISSGTDQRVCIFKWCTTSGLDVTLASQCSSVVADVQGIEVWQQSEDCLTVCVYGIGFEVFSTKYNASGHLSVTL